MADLYINGIPVATGLRVEGPTLVDDREGVEFITDLDNVHDKVEGLTTWVRENKTLYVYDEDNDTWIAQGQGTTVTPTMQLTADEGSEVFVDKPISFVTPNSSLIIDNNGDVGLYGVGLLNIGNFSDVNLNQLSIRGIAYPALPGSPTPRSYVDDLIALLVPYIGANQTLDFNTQNVIAGQYIVNGNDGTQTIYRNKQILLDGGNEITIPDTTGTLITNINDIYFPDAQGKVTIPLGNSGTVTSVTGTDGVNVSNGTSTPEISLGNITPDSVTATGSIVGNNLSGTNTGDNSPNSNSNTYADNAATEAVEDYIESLAYYKGTIYEKTSWNDLSDFVQPSVANVAVVANKLNFTTGSGAGFANTLDFNFYTLRDKWLYSMTFIPNEKTSTSNGLGLLVGDYPIRIRFDGTTNGTSGQISMIKDSGGATVTSAALAFSVGDEIQLYLEKRGIVFYAWAVNKTTGLATIPISKDYTSFINNSTGRFSIANLGGSYTVTKLSISSTEFNRPKVILVGDSKLGGYPPSNILNYFSRRLCKLYGTANLKAGPGDLSSDIVNLLPEIISDNPENVMLSIGCNDIRAAVPLATLQANYLNITNTLTNAGIRVIHINPMWESVIDQEAFNTWIKNTFPADDIIDVYGFTKNITAYLSDGTHHNVTGSDAIFNFIEAANKIKPSMYLTDGNFPELDLKLNVNNPTATGTMTLSTAPTVSTASTDLWIARDVTTGELKSNLPGNSVSTGLSTTATVTAPTSASSLITNISRTYGVLQTLRAYSAKTANYTLMATDDTIDFTGATTATATLPTAVGNSGKKFFIINSGTGVITMATTSSQTIGGLAANTYTLANRAVLVVESDNVNWKVLSYFNPVLSDGILEVSANYTINGTEYGSNGHLTIFANATPGALKVTLDTPANMKGKTVNMIKIDSSANAATPSGNGTTNINNANTFPLTTQFQAVTIKSNGTQYYIF